MDGNQCTHQTNCYGRNRQEQKNASVLGAMVVVVEKPYVQNVGHLCHGIDREQGQGASFCTVVEKQTCVNCRLFLSHEK